MMRRDEPARAVLAALSRLVDDGRARSARHADGTPLLILETGERFLLSSDGVTRLPPDATAGANAGRFATARKSAGA